MSLSNIKLLTNDWCLSSNVPEQKYLDQLDQVGSVALLRFWKIQKGFALFSKLITFFQGTIFFSTPFANSTKALSLASCRARSDLLQVSLLDNSIFVIVIFFGTRPFRCLQYIRMACVLFPFVSKMCPKVSLNKAIVLSSALFSAKLKLFSAEVWKCQHFSAQRRNYQEATARNLFIRDNFDSTSHTALFLREPKQFGRCFSFLFFFFFGGGGCVCVCV